MAQLSDDMHRDTPIIATYWLLQEAREYEKHSCMLT